MGYLKYYGILEGYPRLRRYFGRLADYAALVRPFTLVAPLCVGHLLTIASEGVAYSTLAKGIYIGITLALAQACGQAVNQVVDADLDKLAKPYRPIPSGRLTREEALGVAFLCAIAAMGRAFTVSTYFGLMTCLMLFFAVFYSLPPLSPRRVNPWLSLLWVSFSRGYLPIVAVMGPRGHPYALIALLWCVGWQGTKDIPDAEVDRRFGIKTVANTYGVDRLMGLSLLGTLLAVATALHYRLDTFLALIPLAVYGLANYTRRWRGENTVSWAVFYTGLALVPLLALVEVLLV